MSSYPHFRPTQIPTHRQEQDKLGVEVAQSTDVKKLMMYDANKKSMGLAYVLLLLLGFLGAHRFYTKRIWSAISLCVLTVLGLLTSATEFGSVLYVVVFIWLFIDLFLVPGLVREQNNALAARLNRT